MPLLIVLAAIVWMLDGLTASPAHEINPVALALMQANLWLPSKIVVLALELAVTAIEPRLGPLVFSVMFVVGLYGMLSNLAYAQ